MKKSLLSVVLFFGLQQAQAQFQSATIDGVLGTGEYPNSWADGGGRTFYMTWDDTYLYFAVDGLTNATDAIHLHIDTDPQPLANSGTVANGNIVGYGFGFGGYDGVEYGQLPFRSNFLGINDLGDSRMYFPDGAGGWIQEGVLPLDRGEGGTYREGRIPWSVVTQGGGRPAAINFFFWISFGGTFYGGTSNPADDDFANTSNLTGRHYFNLSQTTNATAGTAFSRLCFINSRQAETIYGFGATNSYWDVASADGQVLLVDKDLIIANQLRIEGGSTWRPSGDRAVVFAGTTGTISNLGFMDANPSFGNTMNYVVNGIVQIATGSNPVDVYNMTVNGIFNMNNVDLRTGNFGTITVSNTGSLGCGTGVVGTYASTSSFVMLGNANIGLSSPDGITLAPAATGNVRTTNRTYSGTGGYAYGAPSGNTLSQVTGNGLPATVRVLAAANGNALTLSAPVTVTDQLVINNNNINLNGNNLTLGTSATFSRTAPGHVITYNGSSPAQVVKSDISSAFTFHVGAGSEYLPVTVTPSTNSTFSVGVFNPAATNGVAGGPAFAPAILNNLVDATWNIDRSAGSGATDVTLSWPAALEGAGFATQPNGAIGISRFSGTWSGFLATSADNTTNTVTASFSSFSPFIVGSSASALPVTFTTVNGRIENGKARINWAAEESDNLSHYEVEKSTNGASFGKALEVARGNNSGRGTYTALDASLTNGANFYRVVAVGKDGDRKYSTTIRLNATGGKKAMLVLPAADASQLALRFNGMESGTYLLNVVNSNGQVVYSRNLVLNGAEQTQVLDLGKALPAGVYHVVLKGQQEQFSRGFVR